MFVSLLGSPNIQVDLHPIETVRRKNRALIYYLAAQRQPVTRDQILARLWPDQARPASQPILRTMLHDLRSQFGPQPLVANGELLSLAPEVQVDVRQFNAALALPSPARPALASALALYRGDFLDGFTLADTPAFDDWAASEREYYRVQAIRGYATLSHLHEAARDLAAALEALTRALAIDPLQEDLQRDSLRLHYQMGDRTGAIRRYEALCKLLESELGVPPMPETRALYDEIINDRLAASAAGAPTPEVRAPRAAAGGRPAPGPLPFTGRANELDTLQRWSASGKLILVEGPPGAGKTRLVDEFISALLKTGSPASRPWLVLRGAGHESEQGLPYQPIADALRGLLFQAEWASLRPALDLAPVWLAEITRLVPDLQTPAAGPAPGGASADEARLWEAVSQFVQSLAQHRHIVLFCDDVHWADEATLGLVGYLARRAASASVVLVGTCHPLAAHSRLAFVAKTLAHEDRLAQMALPPLSESDTQAVAEHLSPANAAALSGWLREHAEGNAYFITELVRHAYQTRLLQADGTVDITALATAPILSPTIQNLILSRLMRLSEDARRTLDVAAVVGRDFDFTLLQCALTIAGPAEAAAHPASALSESALLDALDELRAAALIQPCGDEGFSFDHSLTMEVVLQEMGEARRRRLHRQVAQALEALHAKHLEPLAGLIAHHWAQGHAPERAAPYAFQAGRRAAQLAAWVEAIAFYEQALQAEGEPGQRAAILIALGAARFHKGDFAQASDALRAAIDLARPNADWPNLEAAYLALNLSLLPQSRFDEAVALGHELAQSGPPELALCAQFIWGTALSVQSALPRQAEAHLREAERLLDAQPGYAGLVTRAQIKYQMAGALGQQGQSAQAVALYREALALSQADESTLDLLRQIMLYNNLAYHLHLLGELAAAANYARAGIKLAQERGSLSHMSYLLSTSGEIALGTHNLDEAESYFAEGLRLARQVPVPERIAGLTANLGLVARARGQDEPARQQLAEALELADQLGVRHLAVRIRCWLAPLLPPAEAQGRLREARRIAEESGFSQLLDEIAQLERDYFQS